MYNIKPYSKQRAQELGVVIKPSKKKNKKIDVFKKDGTKIASIGDSRYKDYPTYLKEKGPEYAKERQRLYFLRHCKMPKDKLSAARLAGAILW